MKKKTSRKSKQKAIKASTLIIDGGEQVPDILPVLPLSDVCVISLDGGSSHRQH